MNCAVKNPKEPVLHDIQAPMGPPSGYVANNSNLLGVKS